jgi:hypothetical protein
VSKKNPSNAPFHLSILTYSSNTRQGHHSPSSRVVDLRASHTSNVDTAHPTRDQPAPFGRLQHLIPRPDLPVWPIQMHQRVHLRGPTSSSSCSHRNPAKHVERNGVITRSNGSQTGRECALVSLDHGQVDSDMGRRRENFPT